VYSAWLTEICYDASSSKSKNEPDPLFKHEDAEFLGVIVEVVYSQNKAHLRRLAKDYILNADTNVRVVVGLCVEYSHKKSRKATLSVWRPELVTTNDGLKLRAVEEVVDKVDITSFTTFASF
jgi:hypothetical protein